jgi:hypothetical protein
MIERAALPGAIFVDRVYAAFAQHAAGGENSLPIRGTAFGGSEKKHDGARG